MIYLASMSPRRRAILRRMKLPFRLVPTRYRERTPHVSRSPAFAAMRNAMGKAEGAFVRARRGLVLGADTIVYFNRRIFGKPRTRREAFRMLEVLSGKSHQVYTAIALIDIESGGTSVTWARTRVRFYPLAAASIRRYLSRVNPLDKAGAYAIQSGGEIIRSICGTYTNVMGLPMELLRRQLKLFQKRKSRKKNTVIPRPAPACR